MSKSRIKHDPAKLHRRTMDAFTVLRVPCREDDLDIALHEAEKQRWSHLDFLVAVIGPLADGRRERTVERRIREAHFPEVKSLDGFDWKFNAKAIDRIQIEALATCEFIRRGDNLVFVGQSGVGKSHIMQAIGRQACALDYRVRYITSADLIRDLTASLADKTLHRRLRYYARFELLIIDEFGFDKLERTESPDASNLLFKIIDSRRLDKSTVMITNIDFDVWASYLGDPPLAMALLDRLVEHSTVLKIEGKSYRAHTANRSRTQAAQS
jgi:DNA replication protein DnaC